MKYIDFSNIIDFNRDLFSFRLTFYGYDDVPGQRHLVEHVMLCETAHYTGSQIQGRTQALGCEYFAVTTGVDHIEFCGVFDRVDEVEVAAMLNSIINNALFTPAGIRKEKSIVKKEIEEETTFDDEILRHSVRFEDGGNADVIGTKGNVDKFTRKQLLNKYHEMFSSNRCELAVIGSDTFKDRIKFDREGTELVAKKATLKPFSKKARGLSSDSYVMFRVENNLTSFFIQDMMNSTSGPLYKEIREKKTQAYGISTEGFYDNFKLGLGYLGVYYANSVKTTRKVVDLVMNNSLSITKQEYDEVKESFYRAHKLQLADSSSAIEWLIALVKKGVPMDQLKRPVLPSCETVMRTMNRMANSEKIVCSSNRARKTSKRR